MAIESLIKMTRKPNFKRYQPSTLRHQIEFHELVFVMLLLQFLQHSFGVAVDCWRVHVFVHVLLQCQVP
ncbi:unnamed protein product, partial [Nesidiocoris tenuis]